MSLVYASECRTFVLVCVYLQVVVNALIQAIPSILNVLVVCLVFWLIFSIMGVNLFSDKYGRCVDNEGEKLSPDVVDNKTVCLNMDPSYNYTWVVPDISFDNVGIGYLALLQVVRIYQFLSHCATVL